MDEPPGRKSKLNLNTVKITRTKCPGFLFFIKKNEKSWPSACTREPALSAAILSAFPAPGRRPRKIRNP
jgi:hypothetical protein